MQTRDKKGINNPMYGTKKSPTTIAKLQKLIYVYEAETLVKKKNIFFFLTKFIGIYPTVECIKHFKMGKDTSQKKKYIFFLKTKYLNSKLPFKGKMEKNKNIFLFFKSRVQLD